MPPPGAAPLDEFPGAAKAYLLAIGEREIWAREPDTPRAPASLAKLLTALVLLSNRWDPDSILTVSPRAAAVRGAQLGLLAGDRLRARDALTALLVRSANDACVVLAEANAGSVEAFVERMNRATVPLGMRASRFGDPCGLDAPGQVSTPRDLLRLARAAMAQPEIARRVALADAALTTLGGRRYAFTNSNALIGRFDGAVGVKSGFTNRAGKSVIAAVDRNGRRIWLVMLDGPDRWWAAAGILQAAVDVVDEGR